jgi:hypothetical protein
VLLPRLSSLKGEFMSSLVLGQTGSFDVDSAEKAVASVAAGDNGSALSTMLSQMRASTNSDARSSVTYNVWAEWLQVNAD